MLKAKKLTKYYGDILGVKDLDIEIIPGEVFGFIGPNGAGKSTTIRCIMNMINKSGGRIFINNEEQLRENPIIKNDIGYLSSEINLYDDLTVKKMLEYNASFYKKDCSIKTKSLVKELKIDIKKKVDELSLGNKKKLGIVLALMHDPKFIILDEATSGLDPLMQEKFHEIIRQEKEAGKTIFFSSHNLSEIKKICDRIGIIKDGKLIKLEDINNISDNHFNVISIGSKDIVKFKNKLKGDILEEKKYYLKIMYRGNINELLELISKYKIDKLLIEEPSIEEIFMHYYK